MKKILLLSLFTCMLATCLVAQEVTSTLNGTITDSSGAVLPNAKVTITDAARGLSRDSVTGSAGDYNIPFIAPGTYDMKVEAKGFATVQQKGINFFSGKTLTINQSLKAGGANEVVEVSSAPPMIETTVSNSVGSVSPAEVSNLPIIDRNFSGLETLIPGVRQAEGFDPTKTRVGNISVNGGDGRQVDTAVDGGDNKDLVVGGLVQNFTMEGIQEFNVQTNRYTAEAGHSVAAVVNVVSKSGTNTLHGSAFSLFQNSSLNAQDNLTEQACLANGVTVSNCPKPLLHKYDFGGSLGGPLIKDKLFLFGAFEQKREPGTLTVNPSTIPSLSAFAQETAGFPGGPYAAPVAFLPFPYVDSLLTSKMDWNITQRQNAFLRFGWQKWTTTNDQLINPFTSDGSQGNTDLNIFYDLALQYNFTISPSKVNSFNFHIQDFSNIIPAAPTRTFTYPLQGGSSIVNPYMFFSDGNSVGQNPNVPQQTLLRKYQFSDTFSWTKGTHNLKFGANEIYFAKTGGYFYSQLGYTLQFWDDPVCIQTNTCSNGALYPQGVSTPGAVEDILLNGGSGSTAQPPWSSLGLFVQDDWKVSPRLTLNLGLRWDANIGFLQSQLGNSLTDSNKAIYDLRTQVIANPAFAGLANTEGGQAILGIAGNKGDLQRTTADWKEFQPRIGFAWDITGNGTQILRGGYGIARDQIFQNITLWSIQQSQPTIYQAVFEATGTLPPGVIGPMGQTCTNSGTGPVNPCTFQFGVTPLPTPPPPTTDLAFGATPRLTNPRITDPWSQQFGIGYAWQINPDYAFSADYVHIIGTHEERVLNMNPTIKSVCDPSFSTSLPTSDATYGTVCPNGAGTRLMDQVFAATGFGVGHFNKIYDYSTNNRSFYDGINLQLRKRFSNRIQFQASDVISWSRSWGGFPVASYGGSGLAVDPAFQFLPYQFGYTNFDERNRFTFSGVFQLPKGFSINPIFTAASARPYNMIAGSDLDGDGRSAIDRVCQGSTLGSFIYTPGCNQVKPNTLRGKPYVNMNLRLDKQFAIGERVNLYLYWELYDLFNTANFCNSYEENTQAPNFNTPQSYCNGPSNSAYAGLSGFQAAAVPAFSSQFGFRVNF
jgi:hypothetical protein